MAPHVYVEDLKHHVGQEVTLKGWLYNMAGKGKLYFLQVRDGTGIVQAVVSKADVPEDVFAKVGSLKQEASVIVTGPVREDKRSRHRRRARASRICRSSRCRPRTFPSRPRITAPRF